MAIIMIIKTAALFCFIYTYQLIGQEMILTLRRPSEMISGPFIKHEKNTSVILKGEII